MTATALANGAKSFGITRLGDGRIGALAASGSTFSTVNCSVSGKVDLIYVRDYTPANGDVDLSALKEVFTGCATASDVSSMSGELAMSGHYFGTKQAATTALSGSLTTSAGSCALSGTVNTSGSFSGSACGNAIASTTPPAPSTPAPAPTPTPAPSPSPATKSLSGTWSGGPSPITIVDSGDRITMTFGGGGNQGGTNTWTLSQTDVNSQKRNFSGTGRYEGPGACAPATSTVTASYDIASDTIAAQSSGINADCKQETIAVTLRRQ